MVEESVQVIKVEGQTIWVRAIAKSACGSCQAQKGCGHSLLAKVGQKQIDIPVDRNDVQVELNDHVIIGVPEQAILYSSLLMYGAPLATMIITALTCSYLNIADGPSAALSLLAMLLGFIWVGHKSKKLNISAWQPKVVRKVSAVQSHIPMCDITST